MATKNISINGKVMSFASITEANNYIIANEKSLVIKDEKTGIESIDTKQQERIEKKYVGIEFCRIISTFRSYQKDVLAGNAKKDWHNLDKKTGIFASVLESRKIAAMKEKKGTIPAIPAKTEEKSENAAKTEEKSENAAKTEKKSVKVNGKKKTAKTEKKEKNPDSIENQDLIESILAKTEEKAVIPEISENVSIEDNVELSEIMNDESAMKEAMKDMENIEI